MEKELNLIIDSKGKEIFQNPDELMQELRQNGAPEKDVMTVGLILKTCPSVRNLLTQEDVSRAEVNVMLTAACSATGLSVHAVRSYLGMFLRACKIAEQWIPTMMTKETNPNIMLTPMTFREDESVDQLTQRLNQDAELSEGIRDLEVLSQNGNIRATYTLGKYFKTIDDEYMTERGKVYFMRAANLGYAPAKGALADYELRAERKNLPKAAAYFQDPAALVGQDGREWANVSDSLLQYRDDNYMRAQKVLHLQLWILAFTALFLAMFNIMGMFWGILSIVTQVLALGWIFFIKKFSPYGSCSYSVYAIILSWILLIVGIL